MDEGLGRGKTRLTHAQKRDWLRLLRTENVGPITFRKLINRFGSASHALEALPALSRAGGRQNPLLPPDLDRVERELEGIEAIGARLVAQNEPDYPELLNHIPAAPPLVTLKGALNVAQAKSVGMVGARNASASGQRFAAKLAGELGEAGYVVVSGLARGIDSAAHKAALDTGTIAVLAGGLDRIYPANNMPLAEEIIEKGGALISEMPLGWEPRARDFPRRNRLISGLSLGVVIIEAAKRSGSLITARMALEQNREVFAVPGSPLDPRSEGTNELIRQGATLVGTVAHILAELQSADPTRLPLFDTGPQGDQPPLLPATDPAPSDRERMIAALSPTPTPLDILVETTGLPVPMVHAILLELDLAGRLEWAAGQMVALTS